jgi:glycosyltransferase involved in cell wall biosynthesis
MSVYIKEKPDFLHGAIESLLGQTRLPDEIVIVKDGPLTANLNEVIESYFHRYGSLFRIVTLENNAGLGQALNIGLLHCTHEVVARMDSDDICHPLRFEKQINVLEKNPDFDIVGGWIAEFDETPERVTSIREVPSSHDDIYHFGKFRNPMNHMTVMFRKDAVRGAGNYQHLPLLEDYFLWVRMLINGARFSNIPEPLVFVRTGSNMFQRRRGVSYFCSEIRLFTAMRRLGYVSLFEMCHALATRMVVRLLPVEAVSYFYRRCARGRGSEGVERS